MAKNQLWHDDYWLLLILSIELHIAPQQLFARMCEIANLETPRIERIWQEYSRNPKRLTRAVQLLRNMIGFNSGGGFYEGVEVEETFERDFRPIAEDARLTPVMLILILDQYFRLTPITMVEETPEVQQLARLLRIPVSLVTDVMYVYQHCDPYLNRRDVIISPLLSPCQQIWQRYGNIDTRQLASYANQLKDYFK